MEKLAVLDLFSGIGGFSLGLERTGGFETIAFCEMKPHAQRVLAKNFPGVPCHDDVTTYDFKPGEADVITAGFPCQDISFAGEGAGLSGARSGLYREVIRAIRVVRPVRAVLENVAALLGRGLGVVLGDLASVGYDAEWHCIPASAVGAPHRRDRIWIIANPGGDQHEGCSAPLSGSLAAQLSATNPDADAVRELQPEGRFGELGGRSGDFGLEMADADRQGPQGRHSEGMCECAGERASRAGCSSLADAAGSGRSQGHQNARGGRSGTIEAQERARPANGGWWLVEPDVGRVAHGVPSRVDRLAELGNAVVPQIPEMIGRAILDARKDAA